MATETFGSLLRQYRNRANDPRTGRTLSLMRFVDVLAEQTENRFHFSHATLQNWEKDRSHINSLERELLVAIIKVLMLCGGVQNHDEADMLLRAGGYMPLSSPELEQINPQWQKGEQQHPDGAANLPFMLLMGMADWWQHPQLHLRMLYFISDDLPPDSGDRVMVAWRWFRNRFSAERIAFLIGLLILALFVRELCFRLLLWPPETGSLEFAIALYSAGVFIIPILIAALAWWRQRKQWQILSQPVSGQQRYAFTLVGSLAGFGFTLGIVFGSFLILNDFVNRNMSDIGAWWQFICALSVVLVSYISARQLPREVWTAFRGLTFTHGDAIVGMLFLFVSLTIGWAFYWTFPVLLDKRLAGTVLILTLILTAAVVVGLQRQRDIQKPLSFTGWLVLFAVPWVLFALVQAEPERTFAILGSVIGVLLISSLVEWFHGR